MARQLASSLLDDLEVGTGSIAQSLMKAKRLASLLRDTDAQKWLDLEMNGYPPNFYPESLLSCHKYMQQSGRINIEKNTYSIISLPKAEAGIHSAEMAISNIKIPPNVDLTTLQGISTMLMGARNDYVDFVQRFNGLRNALHSYVTDVQLALSFGDVAEGIFEQARTVVDIFVRSNCPKAAEQLLAIHERLRDDNSESLAHALTSCRRVLLTVADTVFPPQSADHKDSSGKLRKVGQEQYVNRLMAFLEMHPASGSTLAIQRAELEHLGARLSAVYEKTNKGVHAEVSREEANFAVIHTYLVLAEVARAAARPSVPR